MRIFYKKTLYPAIFVTLLQARNCMFLIENSFFLCEITFLLFKNERVAFFPKICGWSEARIRCVKYDNSKRFQTVSTRRLRRPKLYSKPLCVLCSREQVLNLKLKKRILRKDLVALYAK